MCYAWPEIEHQPSIINFNLYIYSTPRIVVAIRVQEKLVGLILSYSIHLRFRNPVSHMSSQEVFDCSELSGSGLLIANNASRARVSLAVAYRSRYSVTRLIRTNLSLRRKPVTISEDWKATCR